MLQKLEAAHKLRVTVALTYNIQRWARLVCKWLFCLRVTEELFALSFVLFSCLQEKLEETDALLALPVSVNPDVSDVSPKGKANSNSAHDSCDLSSELDATSTNDSGRGRAAAPVEASPLEDGHDSRASPTSASIPRDEQWRASLNELVPLRSSPKHQRALTSYTFTPSVHLRQISVLEFCEVRSTCMSIYNILFA